jgi:hypothetical protein
LPPIPAPVELHHLFQEQTTQGRHFRQYIRAYNHVFSFTSMGVNVDENIANARSGVYTFRAQGSIYHQIGSLLPIQGSRPRFLQIYIYDTEHEIDNRMLENNGLDREILEKIKQVLDQYNPFVHVFRHISQREDLNTCRLIIREQPSTHRQYSLPTVSQVAAVFVDGTESDVINGRDIVVQTMSGQLMNVKDVAGYYDPLQYPLLLPHGSYGWDINSHNDNGSQCTCRDFYAYMLQVCIFFFCHIFIIIFSIPYTFLFIYVRIFRS